MKNTSIYVDSPNGDFERKTKLLYCERRECFLYPPKVEYANYEPYEPEDINDMATENNPMPKQCDIFDKYKENQERYSRV